MPEQETPLKVVRVAREVIAATTRREAQLVYPRAIVVTEKVAASVVRGRMAYAPRLDGRATVVGDEPW